MVVSIVEEYNTEIEIPRIDPEDKPKLWFSKSEIHHNTMMTKIRGLVQGKLIELVATKDDFFADFEGITIENDDDSWPEQQEEEQNPESPEEILLNQKARMLQHILNAIMDLPKDDILSFLVSSSLPEGLLRSPEELPGSSEVSSTSSAPLTEMQGQKNVKYSTGGINGTDTTANPNMVADETSSTENNNSFADTGSGNSGMEEQDDNHFYNWILDCGDAWEDLPPVVQMNAMELGYTEISWNEDNQDLPVLRTFWQFLTPNQRTALTFLGNYNEESWNEDVKIVMNERESALMSITEEDESTGDSTPSVQSSESSSEKENEDDEQMMDEFLANFASSPEEDVTDNANDIPSKKDSSGNTSTAVPNEEEDEEAMMDEFLSNFAEPAGNDSKESANATSAEKESNASTNTVGEEDDDEAMMDEFLSNFAGTAEEDGTESATDKGAEKEVETNTSSVRPTEEEDDEAMMDEFLSNFADSATEKDTDNITDENTTKESVAHTISDAVQKEEEDDAMMDEFLANFVEPAKEDSVAGTDEKSPEDSSNGTNKEKEIAGISSSAAPINNDEKADDANDDDDAAMMDEFLSNFVEPVKDVGAATTEEKLPEDSSDEIQQEKEITDSTSSASPINDDKDDDEAMMDEFLSNFVESTTDSSIDNTPESEVDGDRVTKEKKDKGIVNKIAKDEKEKEEAMMDEFLSSFVDTAKECSTEDANEKSTEDTANEINQEIETRVATSTIAPKVDDDNDDKAMMDEFISNFGVPAEDSGDEKEQRLENQIEIPADGLVHKDENSDTMTTDDLESQEDNKNEEEDVAHNKDYDYGPEHDGFVPDYNAVRDEADSDEERPLLQPPKDAPAQTEIYRGEASPLLPHKAQKNLSQKPDPPEDTSWSFSSYFYWIPVVIGLPVAYLVMAS